MGTYNRLSKADKQRVARARLREPPLTCPQCSTKVVVGQLAAHIRERCPGKPEPTSASRWITRREMERLGIDAVTADRWIASGRIRSKPGDEDDRYLLRDVDLVATLAEVGPVTVGKAVQKTQRKAVRKTVRKTLKQDRDRGRPKAMANDALDPAVAKRLRALTDAIGVNRTARRIDIPADTLRRALAGDSLRRGTRALIASEIAKVAK